MYHKQTGADSTDLTILYSQCLVARNPRILTDSPYCGRQVSRLIDQARPSSLPGLPVALRRALSNHGDEIVRDLHPLPFSPGRLSCGRTCPTPSALFSSRNESPRHRKPVRRPSDSLILSQSMRSNNVRNRRQTSCRNHRSHKNPIVSYISLRLILQAPSQIRTGISDWKL